MVRSLIAVIVGYLVMALLVFAAFSASYLAMGADAAFIPGSYEVSSLWLVTSFVLGLIAAVVGGYVCAAIARGGRPPQILAAVVLGLGLLMAIPVFMAANDNRDKTRSGNVSNMEAMQSAQQPGWIALLNPFVGTAGVLLGARLKRGGKTGLAAL